MGCCANFMRMRMRMLGGDVRGFDNRLQVQGECLGANCLWLVLLAGVVVDPDSPPVSSQPPLVDSRGLTRELDPDRARRGERGRGGG